MVWRGESSQIPFLLLRLLSWLKLLKRRSISSLKIMGRLPGLWPSIFMEDFHLTNMQVVITEAATLVLPRFSILHPAHCSIARLDSMVHIVLRHLALHLLKRGWLQNRVALLSSDATVKLMHWLLFRQNLKIALDQSDASEDETEEITVKETTTGSKRARPPSPESSPKKLKMLIVDALTHGGPNLLKNIYQIVGIVIWTMCLCTSTCCSAQWCIEKEEKWAQLAHKTKRLKPSNPFP